MFGELSLIDFFLASPTMLVLLLCSIITVGFAVERTLYFKTSATNIQGFMKDLSQQVLGGNPRAALDYCRCRKHSVARVMAQGLAHLNRGRDEVIQRMNTAIEVEQVEMERNLSVLGTMSNIAPLLGLFGTVVGIIRAFADIARTGSGGGSVVAMGVSEALMTTAAGIVVAVIATIFFNFFVRKIRTRVVQLEDAREEFLAIVHQLQKKSQSAAPARPTPTPVKSPEPVMECEPVAAGILS